MKLSSPLLKQSTLPSKGAPNCTDELVIWLFIQELNQRDREGDAGESISEKSKQEQEGGEIRLVGKKRETDCGRTDWQLGWEGSGNTPTPV